MSLLQGVVLGLVAIAAVVVAATHRPNRQAIALSFYGALLALLFAVLKAPDVALSQLAVGTVIVPFIIFVTLAKMQDPKA